MTETESEVLDEVETENDSQATEKPSPGESESVNTESEKKPVQENQPSSENNKIPEKKPAPEGDKNTQEKPSTEVDKTPENNPSTEKEPPKESVDDEKQEEVEVPKATYKVSVKTQGNMPLDGIEVTIFKDASKANTVAQKKTDVLGNVEVSLPVEGDYYICLSSVPKGYTTEAGYSFSSNTSNIVLKSSVIKGEDISNTNFEVGDVMYDFTVTTAKDEVVTLSELLKNKDMVMLNFWYSSCYWCDYEFPYMSEAYASYSEKIEIVALALDGWDTQSSVKEYQERMQLPFKMAVSPAGVIPAFGITAYPTSVIIDRYGVICAIETGAMTSTQQFVDIFEYFTDEEYQQKLFPNGF